MYKISSAQLTQDFLEFCKLKVTVVSLDKQFLKWREIKSLFTLH